MEHEKSLFMLDHEVSLCEQGGCMEMVHAIPGFHYIKCERHAG